MKIGLLSPHVNGPGVADVNTYVFNGQFLGLTASPQKNSKVGVYQMNRKGVYEASNCDVYGLSFMMGDNPGLKHGRFGNWKQFREGEIYAVNPMCVVYDLDARTVLFNPRDHGKDFPAEYREWLASYPEWPFDYATEPIFILHLAVGATKIGVPGVTNLLTKLMETERAENRIGKAIANRIFYEAFKAFRQFINIAPAARFPSPATKWSHTGSDPLYDIESMRNYIGNLTGEALDL